MEIPARAEVKYWVSRARVSALCADLAALLAPDPHADSALEGGYWVRSLYFESFGLRAWREKQMGVDPRFKLRVRRYPPADRAPDAEPTPRILEVKHKLGGRIHKRRAKVTPADVELLVTNQNLALLAARPDDAVVRHFVRLRAQTGSVRPLLVDYRRIAFALPSDQIYLRANVDLDLSTEATAELDKPGGLQRRFASEQAIFEVKTAGFQPPSWLPRLARRHRLKPVAISKFALACDLAYSLGPNTA